MNRITLHKGGEIALGDSHELLVISGPCVIESRDHALKTAERLKALSVSLKMPFVYKSSYDKANRTSVSSYRGMGIHEGLEVLSEVRSQFDIPVITDVHSEEEAKLAGEVVDIVQIPAFLCRQTDLLLAAGQAAANVLVKKGQFLHPSDMKFAAEKVEQAGSANVLLCERGSCFGYRELIVDFRSLGILRGLGYPVVFDATHSVQIMGGKGGSSGGAREWVEPLSRAAVAFGIDALFLECHENPDSAPSDGPNMLPLDRLEPLLTQLRGIRRSVKQ